MSASLGQILDPDRIGRPILMGVLNVTPDSFSDGGRFLDPEAAVAHAQRMIDEGADIIDVGAESTRPGSGRVSGAEQIARLRRIVPAVAALGAAVSIDTTRAEVAEFALGAGAAIVNDVSAGRDDPHMFALAGERGAAVVLMHMLGAPKTMQSDPAYKDVVAEVKRFLGARLDAAQAAGLPPERCIVDPGIGFGKNLKHNLALLAGIDKLCELGRPVLVGPSRKRFIGEITGQQDAAARTAGTIAACLSAWRRGASIFRVHDVGQVAQAFLVASAVERAGEREDSRPEGGNRL